MTAPDRSKDALSDFAALMAPDREFVDPITPDLRRRRRRRGLLITAIVLVLLLGAAGGYVGWALTAPAPAPETTTRTPPAAQGTTAAAVVPAVDASALSISGGEEYLGPDAAGIWSTSGSGEPRSIASITKIITALIILDASPLASADDPGPTITFTKADHDLYDRYYVQGATIAPMPTGSSLSLHDALAVMLIPSASNYAEVLSSRIFGSQNAFLSAARGWLSAQGLTGTTIVDPTGISAQNTSTPTDLLTIAKLAAANPAIAAIVATSAISLPGAGQLYNTNGLLGTAGITGMKTGNLGQGTYSLLYTATLDVGAAEPLAVTGVLLGGGSRDSVSAAAIASLEGIRAGFHQVPVATAGQEVGTITTAWGGKARLVIAEDASIFTWSDTPITATTNFTKPSGYTDGAAAGSITWTAGPHTVTVPVVVEGAIEPPTEWWRLTHPSELG